MAEVNNTEIKIDSTQSLETSPKNEIELQKRHSISTSIASSTAKNQHYDSKDDEKGTEDENGIDAAESEKLHLNQTKGSSDNQSDVESCINKSKSSNLVKYKLFLRLFFILGITKYLIKHIYIF